MPRRSFFRILILVVLLAISGSIVTLSFVDAHQANLRWILWKHHLWPYDANIALRYLNVDVGFRQSLEGKTRSDIQRFFPVLVSPDHPLTAEQKYYSKDMHDRDWWWIDDSNWAILFDGGKVEDIRPIKG